MGKEMNLADAMVWAYSGKSHLWKDQKGFFPNVLTFPGEKIQWVGQAVAGAYGTFTGGAKAVDIGISPYRLVFAKTGIVDKQCRSFWFEVDFEDWVFEYKKGMLSKAKKYYGFKLSKPRTKTGLNPKFEFEVLGQEKDGSLDSFYMTHDFSSVKGLDAQNSTYKRKLAGNVFQALEDAYQNQQAVSIEDLFILFFDHSRFQELTFALPDDAESDQAAVQPPPASIADQPPENTCPTCGQDVNPGARFCGACGEPLPAAAEPPQEKKISEEKPPSPAEPHPGTGEDRSETEDSGCPSCGQPVQMDWVACPHCAAPLAHRCLSCGKELQSNWLACPYCGEKTA